MKISLSLLFWTLLSFCLVIQNHRYFASTSPFSKRRTKPKKKENTFLTPENTTLFTNETNSSYSPTIEAAITIQYQQNNSTLPSSTTASLLNYTSNHPILLPNSSIPIHLSNSSTYPPKPKKNKKVGYHNNNNTTMITTTNSTTATATNTTAMSFYPPCKSSPPCTKKFFPTGEPLTGGVVDNERRILMEFSPKSDSTGAVVMFFKQMGFEYNIHYTGFPHTFRTTYFNPTCGMITPCMFSDDHRSSIHYYRFKVVRNPYDRAPSSYIHCLRSNLLHNLTLTEQENLSFYDYLLLLKSLPFQQFLNYAGGHAGLQATGYEYYMYTKRQPLFHKIVKVENPQPSLDMINQRMNTNYQLTFTSKHFVKRNHTIHEFIGNISWKDLKNQIPENYGYFYSKEIFIMVTDLFKIDLQLYNYSFPFEKPEF